MIEQLTSEQREDLATWRSSQVAAATALRIIDQQAARILELEAKIDAVRKTATALYNTGVTAGLLGLQLFNDLGEEPPAKDPK